MRKILDFLGSIILGRKKIPNNQIQLPLEVQLRAACMTPQVLESYNLLVSFLPDLKDFNPRRPELHDLYIEYVKKHLTFTAAELIKYLKAHPETCNIILNNSYGKFYTSTTFIQEWQNQYRVGWVPGEKKPINQIRVFSNFVEAATDYVLFSWGFPRLTKQQAKWFEMENY